MSFNRPLTKRARENSVKSPVNTLVRSPEHLPDVAIAAIASYRRQKEVGDFINFLLDALERNSNWVNNVVSKQANFRCALMTGSGPNRFQIQEMIYPSDNQDIRLDVELTESEDYDKVAMAALVKLSNAELEGLLKYIKTRMYDNPILKEDLLKGKAMGLNFAVLRPFTDKQYRIIERVVVGREPVVKEVEPTPKKRRRADRSLAETILRKTRRT
ncbi:hypothetical protein NE865_01680 [Phthorimaea operculella]|nr:hypothetical protein NE865_01680 [Phthorimaea operculella]